MFYLFVGVVMLCLLFYQYPVCMETCVCIYRRIRNEQHNVYLLKYYEGGYICSFYKPHYWSEMKKMLLETISGLNISYNIDFIIFNDSKHNLVFVNSQATYDGLSPFIQVGDQIEPKLLFVYIDCIGVSKVST